MTPADASPGTGYNSPLDPYLAKYFTDVRVRRHLVKSGLITPDGAIIHEKAYLIQMPHKEHEEYVRHMKETTHGMAFPKQPAKTHRTQNMKESRGSDDYKDMPTDFRPHYKKDSRHSSVPFAGKRRNPEKPYDVSVAPEAGRTSTHFYGLHRYDIESISQQPPSSLSTLEAFQSTQRQRPRRHTARRRARNNSKTKATNNSTLTKGRLILHRQGPAVMYQERIQTLCDITMRYFGADHSLNCKKLDSGDEVRVEQQHCGGTTLTVFRERIRPGGYFMFTSRRHYGFPFSLTFYVNRLWDTRISTCCEYRYEPGARLGGKNGRFGMIAVEGAAPCRKCQQKKANNSDKNKKKRYISRHKRQDIKQPLLSYTSAQHEDDVLWTIQMYSPKKQPAATGTNMYIVMYGDTPSKKDLQSNKITLSEGSCETDNKNEFKIYAPNFDRFSKITFGQETSTGISHWYPHHVVLKNEANGQSFEFQRENGVTGREEDEGVYSDLDTAETSEPDRSNRPPERCEEGFDGEYSSSADWTSDEDHRGSSLEDGTSAEEASLEGGSSQEHGSRCNVTHRSADRYEESLAFQRYDSSVGGMETTDASSNDSKQTPSLESRRSGSQDDVLEDDEEQLVFIKQRSRSDECESRSSEGETELEDGKTTSGEVTSRSDEEWSQSGEDISDEQHNDSNEDGTKASDASSKEPKQSPSLESRRSGSHDGMHEQDEEQLMVEKQKSKLRPSEEETELEDDEVTSEDVKSRSDEEWSKSGEKISKSSARRPQSDDRLISSSTDNSECDLEYQRFIEVEVVYSKNQSSREETQQDESFDSAPHLSRRDQKPCSYQKQGISFTQHRSAGKKKRRKHFICFSWN